MTLSKTLLSWINRILAKVKEILTMTKILISLTVNLKNLIKKKEAKKTEASFQTLKVKVLGWKFWIHFKHNNFKRENKNLLTHLKMTIRVKFLERVNRQW